MSQEKKWQFELEEYIRQGEPEQIEKSEAWQIHPFCDDHVIIRTKLEKPSKINGLALI